MNRKNDVIVPETAAKGKRMAVDVNRFPDFDSGKVRAFIYDCFYYLSEVGGETLCKEKRGGDLGVFRRTEFTIVVMEDWNKFCTGKQPKISVTI